MQALENYCLTVSAFEDQSSGLWRVEGLIGAEPDRVGVAERLGRALVALDLDLPKLDVDLIPPKDWTAENLMDFPPLRIARYFIHGSHYREPPPAGAIALKLDAGTAFGSGEHPTTETCLRVIDGLSRRTRPGRVLDMGCGSGILSIAAAKTWRVPVVASDIDPESARVTNINARLNGVARWVAAASGNGYRGRHVAASAPYDLVLANILANPLCALAPSLARVIAPGGYAVLSGLLTRDARRVTEAHRRLGLRLVRQAEDRGWATLLMRRPHSTGEASPSLL